MDFDFGYERNDNSNPTDSVNVENKTVETTDLDTGKIQHDFDTEDISNKDNDVVSTEKNDNTNDTVDNNTNSNEFQEGVTIQIGDDIYTIDSKGNAIDKDGNIFKEAKDVKSWIDTFDKVDENIKNDAISISSIQDAIGIKLTDDNENAIEFENSVEGIKSYFNAILESSKEEHYETAINTLYQKYPILNDVLNYYIANGNSLEGFGTIPDRSNIVIDDTNEQQQESIIRTAWRERNQKGDVDSYIAYLKSSGILLATAKEELRSLQEADEQYRNELAEEANEREKERIKTLEKYWNGVHDVIKSRTIAGYKIPDSMIINRNGQKLSVTPEDFFNYIYRVDKDGKSAYERDLANETPESRRDDEILRAYLKFVGGNYSNLIDMAINKEKVNTLKYKAKERKTTSVKITKPKDINTKNKNIDLGYN